MSKAILITDMPESCDMCDFVEHEHENGVFARMYCGVPGMGEDVSDYIVCRPDNCPLVPMPEKMDICGLYNAEYYAKGGKPPSYKVGWNACIDALKGKEKAE